VPSPLGTSAPKGLTSIITVGAPKGAVGSAMNARRSTVVPMLWAETGMTAIAPRSHFLMGLVIALATLLRIAQYAITVLRLVQGGYVQLAPSKRPSQAVETATMFVVSTRCITLAGTRS